LFEDAVEDVFHDAEQFPKETPLMELCSFVQVKMQFVTSGNVSTI